LERNLADKAETDFEGEINKMEDKIKSNFIDIYASRSTAEDEAIAAIYAKKKRPKFEYQHEYMVDMNGVLRAMDKHANRYTHMCQVKDKLS